MALFDAVFRYGEGLQLVVVGVAAMVEPRMFWFVVPARTMAAAAAAGGSDKSKAMIAGTGASLVVGNSFPAADFAARL